MTLQKSKAQLVPPAKNIHRISVDHANFEIGYLGNSDYAVVSASLKFSFNLKGDCSFFIVELVDYFFIVDYSCTG